MATKEDQEHHNPGSNRPLCELRVFSRQFRSRVFAFSVRAFRLALAALSLLSLSQAAAASGLTPAQLSCEYATDPLGVDRPAPRLFWKLASDANGQRQTAWQVLAAGSVATLARDQGELWDSGKVASDEQSQIPYAGRALKSSQQVFWKVRVWDQDGRASKWSASANFTMGVLDDDDWQAHWVAASTNHPTLLLRHEFGVKPGLRRALAHLCGLGQYELTVNGRKSGEALLAPGWTKYDQTCLYDTHDLTALLKKGKNAVGILLGNGMYNVQGGRYVKFKGSFGPLKAIAQIRLEYADGSVESIGTDGQWRVRSGPLTFSCIYGGEDYDARLEPRGWDRPGFDDAAWESAQVTDGPGGKLRGLSCAAPPLRAFETLKPVRVNPIRTNLIVYDLGQNAPVMARLKVRGPAGSAVKLTPAELLAGNGLVDRRSSGGREAYWKYTLRGDGAETWFSKFWYHGCRYLQAELIPAVEGGALPVLASVEGVVVHTASPAVGRFECSNDLFNRIHTLIRWAQRANLVSVITDCPHRERLGWLEQYHLNGPSLRYEFDLAQLFTKGMNDMADSQLPNGFVPNIAPEYTIFGKGPDDLSNAFRNSPEWGSAFIIVPWQQYEFTGDRELLRRHYERMKRYVACLDSRTTGHVISFGLGDWYDLGPKPPGPAQLTPKELTATAFYFYDTHILAETAKLLGREEDARQFSASAEAIRTAFNARFFDPARHCYSTGSQCANAVPLVMNLAEPENRAGVLAAIVADVRGRGNAVTAGDVGYRYLLRALAEGGRSDVIFDMNNQSDKPGYGYQLKKGATSLTEAWDARASSSQNHFMLGQIMEWFYHDLAGIAPDPASPGFRNILIHPQPAGDLTWARASYESVRGRIATEWKREHGHLFLEVTIPPNTTATVWLPGQAATPVNLRNRRTEPPVRRLDSGSNQTVFAIPSGHYRFRSELGSF